MLELLKTGPPSLAAVSPMQQTLHQRGFHEMASQINLNHG